jgi:hypothetical protein
LKFAPPEPADILRVTVVSGVVFGAVAFAMHLYTIGAVFLLYALSSVVFAAVRRRL